MGFLRQEYPLAVLLLSRFSRVRLCATPWTAAYQAPPSLEFSRQEHWSGLPFPLQCMKVKSESELAQSCPTLSNPMNCSLPGSSIHGIFPGKSTGVGCHCLLRYIHVQIFKYIYIYICLCTLYMYNDMYIINTIPLFNL